MSTKGEIKRKMRNSPLTQMKGEGVLDPDELSLFEWYVHENSNVIERMLAEEREFALQQSSDLADSSGMVAAEYYIKRARYADIIYMASLLETYLIRACERLIAVLSDHNVTFRPKEFSGNKWTKRQKFLELYGSFTFPKKYWPDLQTLVLVRNTLVHENGRTDRIPCDDAQRIEECPGISINQYEVVIYKEYVEHCLSAFKSLVKFLDKQLDQTIGRSLQPQVLNGI